MKYTEKRPLGRLDGFDLTMFFVIWKYRMIRMIRPDLYKHNDQNSISIYLKRYDFG